MVQPKKKRLQLLLLALLSAFTVFAQRSTVNLNGQWQITKTDTAAELPSSFGSTIAVPGLIDMAFPVLDEPYKGVFEDKGPFNNLGNGSYLYNNAVYWYKRSFTLADTKAKRIQLKLNKAMYHTRVFVNGKMAGENFYCFTPAVINIKPFLKGPGMANELVIAVGCRNNLPDTICHGDDFEKVLFAPGIYDDVVICLSGFPFITNVQTAPDVDKKQLRVVAQIATGDGPKPFALAYTVRELTSKKIVVKGIASNSVSPINGEAKVDFNISLPGCKLWSPEDPFLYTVELNTGADASVSRFGMRSFKTDKESGTVQLNNKTYYMRGTNICIFRFFEDKERGDLPWNNAWVTQLHQRFKEMHWNSFRNTIGFPPERWYEIADSLGFLIQDEFPLWKHSSPKNGFNATHLANEYTAWMRERWNHPSVVVWDAQNESVYDTSTAAINKVRALDLSNRPWDNGWSRPAGEADVMEAHPYLFGKYFQAYDVRKDTVPANIDVLELMSKPRTPDNSWVNKSKDADKNTVKFPIIVNEYGWFWLNRDGSPTTLDRGIYKSLFPEANTPAKRFAVYAKVIAAKTEYWRMHRRAAGVLHFCDLGYSRSKPPLGQTSDNFIDIKNLVFEPNYKTAMKSASSPVGVMVDFFKSRLPAAKEQAFPIILINDTYEDWKGEIVVTLLQDGRALMKKTINGAIAALGKENYSASFQVPAQKGAYQLVAAIRYKTEAVQSVREFIVE